MSGQTLITRDDENRARLAKSCAVEGCDGTFSARGRCAKHYRQLRRAAGHDLPFRLGVTIHDPWTVQRVEARMADLAVTHAGYLKFLIDRDLRSSA